MRRAHLLVALSCLLVASRAQTQDGPSCIAEGGTVYRLLTLEEALALSPLPAPDLEVQANFECKP